MILFPGEDGNGRMFRLLLIFIPRRSQKNMDPFAKIPFNLPEIVGLEFENMREATERRHISGDGYYTRLCHAWLEKELGVHKALLTTSCTAALEMIGILLDIR